MNLQTHIKPKLWSAISSTYEAKNYSHAILDAMHYLTEVLREKSGLDGDGPALVGAALGKESPVLRINKLQTVTERDEQEGLIQTLMGLYRGIRNPRTHERIEDTQDTADAIIYFINYLLGILDKSQETFTIPRFLSRVFDEHFVPTEQYAKLLVAEISTGKQLDVLIELYRAKDPDNISNIKYIAKELLDQLSEEQTIYFLTVVSEELKITQNEVGMQLNLQFFSYEALWIFVEDSARLRVENALIKSIKAGEFTGFRGCNEEGRFGILAKDFLGYFLPSSQEEAKSVILEKLRQGELGQQQYVFEYFLTVLPDLYDTNCDRNACLSAIVEAVSTEAARTDSEYLKQILRNSYECFPEDWQELLAEVVPYVEVPF